MRRPIDPESKAAFASKQAARALDRALVESGVVTAREVNRDNSIAASVIDLYRPAKTLGTVRRARAR